MTAQQLAERKHDGSTRPIFDAQRLRDELHHPNPMRQAAAYAATRAVLALAEDRFTFFEGTRAGVWAHIFDADRLQHDIERGRPSRLRPADPLRAVGAQMVLEGIARVNALRSSNEIAAPTRPVAEHVDRDELHRVRERLDVWMRALAIARRAA